VSGAEYTVETELDGRWRSWPGERYLARDEAIHIAAGETLAGNRARIVRAGRAGAVARWFDVLSPSGAVLAIAHAESDARRWRGVERWRCYACDVIATGRRDLSESGGVVEPACDRHREPELDAPEECEDNACTGCPWCDAHGITAP
jgi:hypothetical protein